MSKIESLEKQLGALRELFVTSLELNIQYKQITDNQIKQLQAKCDELSQQILVLNFNKK